MDYNLSTLISSIANEHQRESLRKLQLRHEDYQIYMSGYKKNENPSGRTANVHGEFNVLGTMKRDGQRSEYNIKLYKQNSNPKGSFWCSCPEHKFHSNKRGTVCKHICFLMCRVGRMFDPVFYETKQLSDTAFAAFIDKVENNPNLMKDINICRVSSNDNGEDAIKTAFRTCTKAITEEDMCAICFDNMNENPLLDILSCPDCKNNIHKECMEVWLERSKTCAYCRSDIWKKYKKC